MADTDLQQVPTQNEEVQESEKHEGENGVGNGDQHANGQPKGPEEGANGDAGAADETPVASSVESSPSKPKRSGGGVKGFFSQIFKRKPKEENGQSPKKKEKPKKGAKEATKAPEEKACDAKESDVVQDKQPEQQPEQQTKSDSPAHEHEQQNGDAGAAEPLLPETQDILKIDDLKITLEDCAVAPESHSDEPVAEEVAQNDCAEKNDVHEDAQADADANVETHEPEQQQSDEKSADEEQTVDDQPATSDQHDEISDPVDESQHKNDEKLEDDC